MLNQTITRFQTKKNPNEMTSRKRKKEKFETKNFIHFKDDVMKHGFNNCVLETVHPDALVNAKILTHLDKPCPVGL